MKAWRFHNYGTALLLIALLCLTVSPAFGSIKGDLKIPDEGNTQILNLEDGSALRGEITEVGENEITFKTDMGEMTIEIHKINKITEVSSTSFKGGKYWFPNPNRTRLLFSPTGKMLSKGDGYFSDIYIFFPSLAYGLTDNITISGGMSIFPGLGFDKQLMYFNPKVGIGAMENLDFAVSGMIFRVPNPNEDKLDSVSVDEEDSDGAILFGLLFGTGTYGSDDHHLTVSLGFGFVDDEIANKPAVIIGGETRISRRMSLVSENWIIPLPDKPDDWDVSDDPNVSNDPFIDNLILISYGVRFFGEGLAIDLAFFQLPDIETFFPGIPYIGFVYNF